MGLYEFKYKRLSKKISKDFKLIYYIRKRIEKNKKRLKDLENSGTMMVIKK